MQFTYLISLATLAATTIASPLPAFSGSPAEDVVVPNCGPFFCPPPVKPDETKSDPVVSRNPAEDVGAPCGLECPPSAATVAVDAIPVAPRNPVLERDVIGCSFETSEASGGQSGWVCHH
ncbi:uncharacterized protein K489DRAFT_384170 [Dissoconium aciculare CBS 342.82]|uniref:Uncharacterized protein n=1 Tax=Dissoconium aciculare CBS 342.82 TaxID=1314786 RepID=A0A6J3LX88_9PEZI|nr:uncharacterized protein K489DRAFT_384170 [Dissoconium aciculare CBS 342.82]KAF1819252.1 hypothetical protein K489DRAFT_384170 [Dissoconium aciculare CBS 342.82]